MTGSTLVRVSLALVATGIVSAASLRAALSDVGPDLPFALAFLSFLGLLLLAAPADPPRWATPLAFALAAITYVVTVLANGGAIFGIAAYVIAGLIVYRASPAAVRPLAVAAFALSTSAIRLFGPAPLAGAFPPLVFAAAAVALAGAVETLFHPGLDADECVRRMGPALLAIAAVGAVVARHLVVASAALAPDDIAVAILAAAVPLRLLVRRPSSEAIVTALAVTTFALAGTALVLGKGYHVDAVTAPHHAAELLLRGEDPYRTFDLPQALAEFGLDPQLVTHYADGSVMHAYNYPALSFLVVTPFVAAGLGDIRWLYLLELVLLAVVALAAAREVWRPFVVASLIGSSLVLRQGVLAGVDPTWGVLSAVAWIFLRARWLSAVALGLAIADRQTAWLLAPFYVATVWTALGRGEAARRAGIAAAAALLPNLPFVIDAPAAFVASVLAPLGDLPADGVGLVRFGLAGALPLFPRAVYGAVSAVALVALLVLFWRSRRALPAAAGVFAAVPLYLAWRSLQNYFAFTPLLTVVSDADVLARDPRMTASDRAPSTMPAPAASRPSPRSTAP
jgi:hypothetical protein